MDIRAIAMDLDRTTLNRAGRLSPGNRAALDYAISRGVQVIPASGRAFTTLPQDILDIPGISYCVTSNGAAVCSVPGGEVLMRRCLPPHLAARILDLSDEQGVTYEAFVNGVAYADTLYMADPLGMGASSGGEHPAVHRGPRPRAGQHRRDLLGRGQDGPPAPPL